MPTRKELIAECRARGLHGYSRKSKQELELLLASPLSVQEPPATVPPDDVTESPKPSETAETPNDTVPLPLHVFSQAWVSVCLGIPPYLLPYMKYQKPPLQ